MIISGMLVLGIGMIATGTGIGVRNIYNAGKAKGSGDTETMKQQIQAQKKQINELIESEYKLNKLINNMNKNVRESVQVAEEAVILHDVLRKKHTHDTASEVVACGEAIETAKENITEQAENIVKSADKLENDIKAAAEEVEAHEAEAITSASEEAEDALADAIVDAGISEEEALAKECAKAIREEEEAASAKRYKAAKKGGKK